MRVGELLKDKREEILRAAAKHGAYNVRLFGSVARGEYGEGSDVDILVELEPGRSLLDHAGLPNLSRRVGVRPKVDDLPG